MSYLNKSFFPHSFIGEEQEEEKDEINFEQISDDKVKSDILVARMKKIEELLRQKFSNNWTSIRKAFLDIDMDYDGYITAEDIARQFGKDNKKLDFRDLRTLIKNRDSKRKGKVDFKDFCRWMGGAIEPSETFYFRHDSLKNPQYEENLVKQNKSSGESKKIVSDKIMNSNLMKRILDKISTQWKTLKKAFSDLNQGKNGWISEVDLKKYLVNWGLNITDEQFTEFYNFLDYDKDGHITYEDFKQSVGSVISPVEFLYFRQDLPLQKIVRCKHSNCWEETKGLGNYCHMHKKIVTDKTLRLVSKIQNELGRENWSSFVSDLKNGCDSVYQYQITIKNFFKIIKKYNINVNQDDRNELIECFHLKDEGNVKEINVRPIFDFGKTKAINKIYKTIDLEQREDDEELSINQKKLMIISEDDFFKILTQKPAMLDFWKNIRKQDADSNGFLTLTELSSTFQLFYPKLKGKSLFKIFKPFTSIQNKQLVDYKKFKDYIDDRMVAYTSQFVMKSPSKSEISRNNYIRESHTTNHKNLPTLARDIKSPSMLRMEQMKEDILRAADSSPLLKASKHLSKPHNDISSPKLDIKKRTALDGLISPRSSRVSIQRGKNQQRYNQNLITGGKRVLSPDGISGKSKFSQYSTFSASFFPKSNDALKQKLEYEWKNIFRSLSSIDINSSGFVTKKEFTTCIEKNGVYLTRDELAKLIKAYSHNGEVNYVKISTELGLHKNSFDYMRSSLKYLKNASLLKSIQGINDSKSQLGEFMKGAKTDRVHRESTKGAIKFVLENKRDAIDKLINGFDKSHSGTIDRKDFTNILKTMGIYLGPTGLAQHNVKGDQIDYNSFIHAHTAN